MERTAEANIIAFQSLKLKLDTHMAVALEKIDQVRKMIQRDELLLTQETDTYLKYLTLPQHEFGQMLSRDETHWVDNLKSIKLVKRDSAKVMD